MIKEEWVPVKGFELFYEISNLGGFRSKTVLRPRGNGTFRIKKGRPITKKSNGYLAADLYGENGLARRTYVHILVAEHFVPNPEGFPNVRHKDDVKLHNVWTNLVWGTQAHNVADAVSNGLMAQKLTEAKVRKIKLLLRKYGCDPRNNTQKKLAGEFGVSIGTISRINRGRIWCHVRI